MLKHTLYFSRPCYLSIKHSQLCYTFRDEEVTGGQAPLEDLGFVVIDHAEITLTQPVITGLHEHNIALITCDRTHHPISMFLSLDGHQLQQERYRHQLEAGVPLKKQLWAQTIKAKLTNQAAALELTGKDGTPLRHWAEKVRSGDEGNLEAQGSRYYWQNFFKDYLLHFTRERFGNHPNPLLNYGYAILRAAVARGLVGSGLFPVIGIHHHNRYNAYCLADDIMEPYRPFVDLTVLEIIRAHRRPDIIDKEIKGTLLGVLTRDTRMNGEKSPLMVAIQTTTSSLYHCFAGTGKKITYPRLQ